LIFGREKCRTHADRLERRMLCVKLQVRFGEVWLHDKVEAQKNYEASAREFQRAVQCPRPSGTLNLVTEDVCPGLGRGVKLSEGGLVIQLMYGIQYQHLVIVCGQCLITKT